MFNSYNDNRKLQFLFETKFSNDEKVPKTGRVLRNKIFVIGFPPNCTENDLEKFFSNFGLVREARIIKDDNGITKGYAFITFAKERSVVHALEYRCPLYFMDRKLSINPAVKKYHQFIQNERCLSTSTSFDAPSDVSNGSTIHHYYNPVSQPYFHISIPSHSTYCSSEPAPLMWHHYLPPNSTYSTCPYITMSNNTNLNVPLVSQFNNEIYHNSMLRYAHLYGNTELFQ